jgi:polyisoprenoid-binding protein YceI
MRQKLLFLAVFLFFISMHSYSESLQLIKERSSITFVSTLKMLFYKSDVPGTFSDFTIDANKAPILTDSSVKVSINVKSIDTKDQKRDKHLRTKDFFDVDAFPQMTFSSTSIKQSQATKADIYEINGNLTVKGKAHPIKFSAEAKLINNIWNVKGETILSRKALGITYKSSAFLPDVLDDIKVKFDIFLSGKKST